MTDAHDLVAATRDDPAGRLTLLERTYRSHAGDRRALAPFRRAALSFMRWQLRRGLLEPPTARSPGSRWWRAVNERLLRDQCEAMGWTTASPRAPSSSTVELWLSFVTAPNARAWYRAHNASIVAAYSSHHDLAEHENEAERFFLNVVLLRVLYAHALAAAPQLALGRLAPLGRLLGDPRLGAAGVFLSLGRILPDRYPALDPVDQYVGTENGVGRLLDYGVIGPRLQWLYEWSAVELDQPGLSSMIRDGAPIYAFPYECRRVWHPADPSLAVRLLLLVTSP